MLNATAINIPHAFQLAHVDVLGFGASVVFELSSKSVQPISSTQPVNPAEVRIEQVVFHWIGTMSTAQPINSRRSLTGWWRVLLLALVLLGSLAGFAWWWTIRGVSTENAYVVGNVTPISSEVSGNVVTLYADDNMQVKAGDPLLQVDPIPYQIAVDEARADFRQAVKDAEAASVNVRLLQQDRKAGFEAAGQKRGELNEALSASELEARARESLHAKEKETLAASKAEEPGLLALERNARDYAERFKKLAATGDIPVQDSENRDAAWQESVARLNNLKSRIGALESQVMASELAVRQAEVKVRQARRAVAEADAGVERARAALLQPEIADSTYAGLRRKVDLVAARLAQARLRLANTLVRAPMAGIVSKRTAQLGQSLVGGQPFLSITPLEFDNVWVVANLREDQAARTRLGQPVAVTIDAIPDRVFSCWVESVSGGTGSAFSLFPPDNATGNFTRIVQRLPVRLRFSEKDNPGGRVRPGMSCKVLIDTAREIRSSNRDW